MRRANPTLGDDLAFMSESFPYRTRMGTMLLAAAFFGGCAAIFAYKAATTDRGLIINGLIELDPSQAKVFFRVLEALSWLFVVAAIFATIHGRMKNPVLTLADDYIDIPTGIFGRREITRIEFKNVTGASLDKISGQQILNLWTPATRAAVAKSLLPDGAFERVLTAVRSRVPALQE